MNNTLEGTCGLDARRVLDPPGVKINFVAGRPFLSEVRNDYQV